MIDRIIDLGYFFFSDLVAALLLYLCLAFIGGSWNVMDISQENKIFVVIIWGVFNIFNYITQFIKD